MSGMLSFPPPVPGGGLDGFKTKTRAGPFRLAFRLALFSETFAGQQVQSCPARPGYGYLNGGNVCRTVLSKGQKGLLDD